MKPYDYNRAFVRNQGWLTAEEQQLLRNRRIAIAGLGGVGGAHLLTLSRLGIGRFNISDLDCFELANFNRQAGAFVSTLDAPKLDTLERIARDINPELDIRRFPEGIGPDNVEAFLEDVDLYVDGLDFFALEARKAVFSACARKGIPAVTAAPLGIGSAVLNFLPGHMTFEEYFRLEGQNEQEQLIRFLLGLSPSMLQRAYLVDPTTVDFLAHKGPSTPMACDLCAGLAATQALKILLHRGRVVAAPRGLHFDAYRNKLKITWRPGGNKNPVQRIGLRIARWQLSRMGQQRGATDNPAVPSPDTPMERILELARWAPSGDNTQPWRFEVKAEDHLVIHASDTRDWCVYDLQGRASQLAVGALLETLAIAASAEQLSMTHSVRDQDDDTKPVLDVRFTRNTGLPVDPLIRSIRARATQRRPFSARPLNVAEKQRLEQSLPTGHRVLWFEGAKTKRTIARLLFDNAKVRLTIPEGYQVHSKIIEWDAQFSTDRIPDQALGVPDRPTQLFMRWAMASWQRVRWFNRYLAGTLMPRIQLDLLPAMRCGAHFMLSADRTPQSLEEFLDAGRALQRFWLTATALGLSVQPEMTPVIFSGYVRQGLSFTEDRRATGLAEQLATRLEQVLAERAPMEQVYFMGRIGESRFPTSRSTRLSGQALRK